MPRKSEDSTTGESDEDNEAKKEAEQNEEGQSQIRIITENQLLNLKLDRIISLLESKV